MEKLQAGTICHWINGRLIGDELVSVDEVSTDTRTLVKGSLLLLSVVTTLTDMSLLAKPLKKELRSLYQKRSMLLAKVWL